MSLVGADQSTRRRMIVHISTVHVAGDTRIVHKECRALIEAGYDVTLITASDGDVPLAQLTVRRLPAPKTRLHRSTRTVWQALTSALHERADLYHVHDPELIALAVILKAFGKRVVYDAHEHLPRQVMNKEWIAPILRRPIAGLAGAAEAIADRFVDGVIVANPSTAPRFRASHTALVENFARIPADDKPPTLSERSNTVVYVGGLSEHRGLRQMIAAIRHLGRPEIRLLLIGPMETSLTAADLDGVRDQVEIPGRLHRDEVDVLLRDARVGLSVLQPVPNFTSGHYPTKLFEYMAARMPVVASDFPLYRAVVDESQCGRTVDPTSPALIAEAIANLLDHPEDSQAMADRGRAAVLERYSWSAAERSLLELYHHILDAG